MRILLASSSSGSRGGGELALLAIGEALRSLGHEVSLWCSDHPRMDELADRFSTLGPVHRSPYKNSYHDRRTRSLGAAVDYGISRKTAGEWRRLSPDVIHLNKQNLEDGLDLIRAAECSGLPAICMIHITQPAVWLGARFGALRDWIAARCLGNFQGPFVTTPETRADSLRTLLGTGKRIAVIHNGVKRPVAAEQARHERRKELGICENTSLFITLGRIEEQKQPLEMLRIARRCCEAEPGKVRFVWVGSGSMEEAWLAERKALGLEDQVLHIPWTNQPGDWLAAADAMLHPARFEGMPFAVLEALASDLPVCMTPELIAEIPPFEAPGIIPIHPDMDWLNLILDPQKRAELSTQARQLHEKNFSLSRMGEEYVALYHEAIRTKKHENPLRVPSRSAAKRRH